jgi:hypothetical protein
MDRILKNIDNDNQRVKNVCQKKKKKNKAEFQDN